MIIALCSILLSISYICITFDSQLAVPYLLSPTCCPLLRVPYLLSLTCCPLLAVPYLLSPTCFHILCVSYFLSLAWYALLAVPYLLSLTWCDPLGVTYCRHLVLMSTTLLSLFDPHSVNEMHWRTRLTCSWAQIGHRTQIRTCSSAPTSKMWKIQWI